MAVGRADSGATEGKRVAPAFNTGGGGFEYEDLVGAWVAAGLAAGASPLGVEIGVPRELRFQAAASGSTLDDIVITGDAEDEPRWCASIKSFDMLVGSKLPDEFVDAAWREILEAVRPGPDRVGLVCGSTAEGNWSALEKLIGDARADSKDLASRIDVEGAFNETERSIWASCRCPEQLAARHGVCVPASPAKLLAVLLPLRLDLLKPGSAALAQAVAWCRSALTPELADRNRDLWDALCAMVSEVRPKGGTLGWPLIVSRLGSRFAFRLRPDVEPDWRLLHQHTELALSGIRDQLGEGVTLPRAEAWTSLQSGASTSPVTFLSGPSGCGKTALAKRWLTDGDHHRLWLSSADLDDGLAGLRMRLALRRPASEVLTLAPASVRVVIDGLDRSFNPGHFAAAAALARAAHTSDARVQVLMTSQQMELPRVSRQLMQVNAPPTTNVPMQDLDDADVAQVLREQPHLARVAVGGRLESVLLRPKLLDLILRAAAGSEAVLQRITDEAAVAELWWQHFALGGPSPAARQELLLRLATQQANQLLQSTPAGELAPADVERADQLRVDGVLDEDRARYAFAHDLFSDWTLLQRLRALGEGALEQLGPKAELPTWHRAIRLHALTVLREDGLGAWSSQRARLDADDQRLIAELFLDATLFADDAVNLMRTLWPSLVADRGALLQRLLRRFLHVATLPDPRGAPIFSGATELEAHWATQARVPLWPLWLPVLEVLHEERDAAIDAAPSEVASIADLWLRHARPGCPSRDRAADIGLAVGRFILEKSQEDRHFDEKLEAVLWRCTLAVGAVAADGVLDLIGPALETTDGPTDPFA